MDYLQMAKDAVEQSQGDIRYDGQKERLMELATIYAAIAQAEATVKQAEEVERIRFILENSKAY